MKLNLKTNDFVQILKNFCSEKEDLFSKRLINILSTYAESKDCLSEMFWDKLKVNFL